MLDTRAINPDTRFIRDVMAAGGEDLKKCYQCATCSVVCELSPEDAPFPRQQMLYAQWGLRDRLMADPAVWLCHNCRDCSERCPRGARPGDVLGAVRNQVIRSFACPAFMGRLVGSPAALPVLFLIPMVLFALMAAGAPGAEPGEPLEFAHLFPILWLEVLFFTISGVALLGFGVGIARFMAALKAAGLPPLTLGALAAALVEIGRHGRFSLCANPRARYWGHFLTFWGFMALAVMGTVVGVGTMLGIMHTPLDFWSPWKVFANLGAIAILAGTVTLLVARLHDTEARARSTYFDWLFLLTLLGVAVTGVMAEALRLGQIASAMYPVYYVHLVLIFSLFLYAPYSKFAHLAYRTVAMAATGQRR
jgi:quinone-modifying oxidoreductase subunit QmoC